MRQRQRTSRVRRGGFDFKAELDGYEPPTFPAIVTRALEMLADPDSEMSELADLLELDPGITARMLSFVNSAAIAPRSRVKSVRQAAVMLGRNQLESLLITAGTHAVIPQPMSPNFDHVRFWTTAAKRAALAGALAAHTDPTQRSENFTTALLQDMAVPVLTERAEPYHILLEYWHNGGESLANLEVNVFGWHHGDVAAWMGETWGFPDDFIGFMSNHHGEPDGPLLPAYLVAPIREVSTEGDTEVVETASAALGLSTDSIIELIDNAEVQAKALAELLT